LSLSVAFRKIVRRRWTIFGFSRTCFNYSPMKSRHLFCLNLNTLRIHCTELSLYKSNAVESREITLMEFWKERKGLLWFTCFHLFSVSVGCSITKHLQ